jgi:hypothetical protein
VQRSVVATFSAESFTNVILRLTAIGCITLPPISHQSAHVIVAP